MGRCRWCHTNCMCMDRQSTSCYYSHTNIGRSRHHTNPPMLQKNIRRLLRAVIDIIINDLVAQTRAHRHSQQRKEWPLKEKRNMIFRSVSKDKTMNVSMKKGGKKKKRSYPKTKQTTSEWFGRTTRRLLDVRVFLANRSRSEIRKVILVNDKTKGKIHIFYL